jgi:hypothetical protein
MRVECPADCGVARSRGCDRGSNVGCVSATRVETAGSESHPCVKRGGLQRTLFTETVSRYVRRVGAVNTGQAAPAPRTASQPEDEALQELPFPRYQIALVQDESEMILQSAYDLFPFLGDDADPR